MWTVNYKKICTLEVQAPDARYEVSFSEQERERHLWEVDPMCDAVGMLYGETTDQIKVEFTPFGYMAFPEDRKRPQEYVMTKIVARELYKLIRDDKPNYWFALDMASFMSKK